MRYPRLLTVGIAIVVLFFVVIFVPYERSKTYSVAIVKKLVAIKSKRKVAQAYYYNTIISDDRIKTVETESSLEIDPFDKALLDSSNQFTVRIVVSLYSYGFQRGQSFAKQLVIYVVFADGTSACRVIQIPDLSRQRLVADFD